MLTRTDPFAGEASARLPVYSVWLLVLAGLWLANLQYVSLTDPVEGRYAEIPREMHASGDWVTPRLDGVPYFARPPLQYWLTASAYATLGEAPWVSRLATALLGLLGMLLLAIAARPLVGASAARLAALVLISCPLYVLLGHFNTLDMGPSVLLAGVLVSLCRALHAERDGSEERRWMYGAWISLALAVLAAGPLALLSPLVALMGYCVLQRDAEPLRRLHPVGGLVALAGIAAPWFVLTSLRYPGFPAFYFTHALKGAFAGAGAPPPLLATWLLLPVAALGVAPWVAAAVAGARTESGTHRGFDVGRFLGVWCGAVIGVATVAGGSLLPGSLLPMVPAVALLAGRALTTQESARLRALRIAEWFGLAAMLACIGAAGWFLWAIPGPRRAALFGHYVPWLLVAATTLALGTRIAAGLRRVAKIEAAVLAIALTWVIAAQTILTGGESLAPIDSGRRIAQRLMPLTDPGTPLFALGSWPQSVPFYLRREVVVVGDPGELEVEFAPGTPQWIPTLREFADAWRDSPHPFAIVDRALIPALRDRGLRVGIVAETQRAVLVDRPSP